jgi:hypothetical protein
METLSNKSKLWALMLIDSDFDDAGLSMAGARVYVHLCRRADKAHVAWPGIDSIADTVRANRKTVIVAIKELEQRGFIRVSRAWGSRSNYEILPKHCWLPCPKTDRSEGDTSPLDGPEPETDQYLKRTGPKEEQVRITDGTSPPDGPPPVQNEERKDIHRRITNKRITTTTTHERNTTHARNNPAEASTSCGSVCGGGNEDSGSATVDETWDDDAEAGEQLAAAARSDHSYAAGIAQALATEFRLSGKQRQVVAEYCESHGGAYLQEKAEIVRSQPCRNPAGAFLAALREDWQPAVRTGDSNMNDDLAQRMGWQL